MLTWFDAQLNIKICDGIYLRTLALKLSDSTSKRHWKSKRNIFIVSDFGRKNLQVTKMCCTTVFGVFFPPFYLHLIFEISSSRNWFLNLIFELDFLSISNLIFTACVACKNPVRNRQKIKFKNQVQKSFSWNRDFKNQVQMDRGEKQ